MEAQDAEQLNSLLTRAETFGDLTILHKVGSDYHFGDVFPLIEETFDTINLLRRRGDLWARFPAATRNENRNHLSHFLDVMDTIQQWVPTATETPSAARQKLAGRVEMVYRELFGSLIVPLRTLLLSDESHDPLLALEQLRTTAEEQTEAIREVREEAQEVLEAVRQAASRTGVSTFAAIFKDQAKQDRNSAIWWLIASVLLTIGVGALVGWTVLQLLEALEKVPGADLELQVQTFLAKLLLVLLATGILFQVFKQYTVRMHLYTMNKHRENSLNTFSAFIESTDDQATRDAVLIQATRAIFEAGDTGYVGRNQEGPGMLEVTRIMHGMTPKT